MRKVCIQCLKPIYPNHHFRGCPKLCFSCMEANFDTPCKPEGAPIECKDCRFTFASKACFDRHKFTSKAKKNSLCSLRKICPKCDKCVYTRDKRHACDRETDVCSNCDIIHTPEAPFCYIKPKKPKS